MVDTFNQVFDIDMRFPTSIFRGLAGTSGYMDTYSIVWFVQIAAIISVEWAGHNASEAGEG